MTVKSQKVEGDVVRIPLTKGYEAIVDVSDLPLVRDQNWHAFERGNGLVYARRYQWNSGSPICFMMHRVIIGAPDGLVVDHIDGNTLDNRRSNLRVATMAQNLRNGRARSGYKGVSRLKKHSPRPWQARIRVDGKDRFLGTFESEEHAAKAYNAAAIMAFGEFARLNVIK